MASASPYTDHHVRHFRLLSLLLDLGTRAVRKKFEEGLKVKNYTGLQDFLNTNEKHIKANTYINEIKEQLQLLFPQRQYPNIETFDLSLLTTLISYLVPDHILQQNLRNLRKIRNNLQHYPYAGLSLRQFNLKWFELTTLLVGFDPDPHLLTEINAYKTKPFSDTEYEELRNRQICLLDTKVGRVSKQITGVDTKVTGIDTKVGGVSKQVTGVDTKVTGVDTKVTGVIRKVGGVSKQVTGVDTKVTGVDTKVTGVDTKVTGVDTKVTGVDTKVDGLSKQVTGVDTKITGVDTKVTGVDTKVTGVDTKVTGVDTKVDGVSKQVTGVDTIVTGVDTKVDELLCQILPKLEGIEYTLNDDGKSVHIFWNRKVLADIYRVEVLHKGKSVWKYDTKIHSCDINMDGFHDNNSGEYTVKVTAIQNVPGDAESEEMVESTLSYFTTQIQAKGLRTRWANIEGVDWGDIKDQPVSNLPLRSYMDELPGYIPVRLIPLMGVTLGIDDDTPVDISHLLQYGVRFFKVTFDRVITLNLLQIASDFVRAQKSEAVFILYHRYFYTADFMPPSVEMPGNVVCRSNIFSALKLKDVQGKVVMLDSKEHSIYDNLQIYNNPQNSNNIIPKYFVDYSKLESSNELCIKYNPSENKRCDRTSDPNQSLSEFLEENCETYENCHSHEGPMMVVCSDSEELTEEGLAAIGNNPDIITCGTLSVSHSVDSKLTQRIINIQCRWRRMVLHLIASHKKLPSLKRWPSTADHNINVERLNDVTDKWTANQIAFTDAATYFSIQMNEEIGRNNKRFENLVSELHNQKKLLKIEHKIELQNAFNANDQSQYDLLLRLFYDKSEVVVESFLTVLMQNSSMRPLVYWIKEFREKVQKLATFDVIRDEFVPESQSETQHVCIKFDTQHPEGTSITQQDVGSLVMENLDGFLRKVAIVGRNIKWEKKCIQISLDVCSQWEMHNIKSSVEYGLFLSRYCRWVSENGQQYAKNEEIEVSFEVDRVVWFVHLQHTPGEFFENC